MNLETLETKKMPKMPKNIIIPLVTLNDIIKTE